MARPIQVEALLAGVRDTSGEPLASGKVYFYEPGTTTSRAVFSNALGTSAASQPISLDAAGRAQVYAAGEYRIVVKDSDDTTVYDWDNVRLFLPDSAAFYGGSASSSGTAISVTTNPAMPAYEAGMLVWFVADRDINTSPSSTATLNVSSLGAKDIKVTTNKYNLPRKLIQNGMLCLCMYDGTDFILLNPESSGIIVLTPTVGAGGSMTYTLSGSTSEIQAHVTGIRFDFQCYTIGTTAGTASNYIEVDIPTNYPMLYSGSPTYAPYTFKASIIEDGADPVGGFGLAHIADDTIRVFKSDAANYGLSADVEVFVSGFWFIDGS